MSRASGPPGPVNTIGVSNIAPAIMALGSEAQRRDGSCDPCSAAMRCGARGCPNPMPDSDLALPPHGCGSEEGDHFVVSGQKTWNSMGSYADWCQLYVRTDPTAAKHKGISCLLVDMTTPGITRQAIADHGERLHLLWNCSLTRW